MLAYHALGMTFEDRATSTILMHSSVHKPDRITVGAHSIIGRFCLLDGRGDLTIGRNVNITSYTLLVTGTHAIDSDHFESSFAPIVIEDYAWLATRTTVLPGVTIGRGAVIAAGALLTANAEPMTVYAGVPARPVRSRQATPAYQQDYRPSWV
jgi:acetyltransferase-like isoleucine patch superfamily enzyme